MGRSIILGAASRGTGVEGYVMGWETRRGKRVYYRKVREGRRVRSFYCGSGERGEAEVALRGLDLGGSCSSYPRPAAPPVSKFRPWE